MRRRGGKRDRDTLRHRVEPGLNQIGDMRDDGAVEAFLAAEIILDGRGVDAGVARQRAGTGALVAFIGKNFYGC